MYTVYIESIVTWLYFNTQNHTKYISGIITLQIITHSLKIHTHTHIQTFNYTETHTCTHNNVNFKNQIFL